MSKKLKTATPLALAEKALTPIVSLLLEFITFNEFYAMHSLSKAFEVSFSRHDEDMIEQEIWHLTCKLHPKHGFRAILQTLDSLFLPYPVKKRWLTMFNISTRSPVEKIDLLGMIDWDSSISSTVTTKASSYICALCHKKLVTNRKPGSITWHSFTYPDYERNRAGFFSCFYGLCQKEWVELDIAENFFGFDRTTLMRMPRLGANLKSNTIGYHGPRFLIRDLVAMIKSECNE